MGQTLRDFMKELRKESRRAGKEADLDAFAEHFRRLRVLAVKRARIRSRPRR